jgi:hypothetical protein
MWQSAALGALFMVIAATLLPAQDFKPRDLYLQKTSGGSEAKPALHHLGLRYTLLLVDPSSESIRAADPDEVFHKGDCLAVELTPNRDGTLYVLNHGSSGGWRLLIPDSQAPDASGGARAGVTLRVPSGYCFGLDDKPGTETLVLAITERAEDAGKLRNLSARAPSDPPPQAAVIATADADPANVDALRREMESWQRIASRDLKIEKITDAQSPDERPNSVYAVLSSAGAADRLVIEIKIRHE